MTKHPLKILKGLLGIVSIAFLFWQLYRSASGYDWQQLQKHPGNVSSALLFGLVSVFSQFWVWLFLVNRNGSCLTFSDGYKRYCVSFLSRYLPVGKVLQFAAFWDGTDTPALGMRCMGSLLLSILCGLVAGSVIVCLGWVSMPSLPPGVWVAVAAVVGGLLVAIGLSRESARQRLAKWWPSVPLVRTAWQSVSIPQIILTVFIQLIFCWFMEGMAILMLLNTRIPVVTVQLWTASFVSYALASFSGYVIPITPGGLGVREGVWFFWLRPQLGTFNAAFLCLGMRFILMLADGLFVLPFLVSIITPIRKHQTGSL